MQSHRAAAGQRVARAALAAGADPRGPGADGGGASRPARPGGAGHRRARPAHRRDAAGQPAAVVEQIESREDVDLLGLAAEEASRTAEAEVTGKVALVRGEARLLRRRCATCSRTRCVTGRRRSRRRWRGRAGACACACATAARASRRKSASASSSRSTGRPRGPASDAGSGLGLALVREIARRHGGEARCLARDGGGSCFEVDLPAIEA